MCDDLVRYAMQLQYDYYLWLFKSQIEFDLKTIKLSREK